MAKKATLGVCSTGSRLKLAASCGETIFSAQKKILNQEKPLFAMLARLLKRAGAGGLANVKIFCAVRGPGRFTGIRIGLTLAKVLGVMTGAKVFSATLFEIMALQAFESEAFKGFRARCKKPLIAALMRAFKDEYFCQVFYAGPRLRGPRPAGAPQWLKAQEMKDYLSALGPGVFVIGDSEEDPSVYDLAPALSAKAGAKISRVLPDYVIKTALALKNVSAEPLYLKPARYEMTVPGRR